MALEHYFVRTQFSTFGSLAAFGSFLMGQHFKEKDRQAHPSFFSLLNESWSRGRRFPFVRPDLAVRQFSPWHFFHFCACACNDRRTHNQQRENGTYGAAAGYSRNS
jgi:hypothetical protein